MRHTCRSDGRDGRVLDHLGVAYDLADRYATASTSHEDLLQEAALALVAAVDRFDPDRDGSLHAFVVTSVLGALRRHVRDTSGAVRAPRTVHERRTPVRRATAELERTHGRPTNDHEVAMAVGLTPDEVREVRLSERPPVALAVAADGRATVGIDDLDDTANDDATAAVRRWETDDDPAFAAVDDRDALRRSVSRLGHDDRDLLRRHYVAHRTQIQLARELGVSQAQVSRRLRATIEQLRHQLADGRTSDAFGTGRDP